MHNPNPYEPPKSVAPNSSNLYRSFFWGVAGGAIGVSAFVACIAIIHFLTHAIAGVTPDLYFGESVVGYENQFRIAIAALVFLIIAGFFAGLWFARRGRAGDGMTDELAARED